MRKSIKVTLFIASGLVGIGLLLMCLSVALGGLDMFFNSNKVDVKRVTATFENVDTINVKDVSCDVKIIKSQDDKVKVTYGESEKFTYFVEQIDNTLFVELDDYRHWYDYIFAFANYDFDLVVEVPEKTLNELNVKCTSGDIEALSIKSLVTTLQTTSGDVEVGGNVGVLYASATSGDVKVNSDTKAESIDVNANSGKINLSADVENDVKVKNTSGRVTVNNLNCGNISLDLTSGRIEGKNINATSIKADTISGRISLTDAVCTGDMTIETTSGGIDLERVDAQNYDLQTTSGSIRAEILTPKFYNVKSKNGAYPANNGTEQGMFNAKTTSGSIDVDVVE